jgi:hypothetical protein
MSEWSEQQHDPPAHGGENPGVREDVASEGDEGANTRAADGREAIRRGVGKCTDYDAHPGTTWTRCVRRHRPKVLGEAYLLPDDPAR